VTELGAVAGRCPLTQRYCFQVIGQGVDPLANGGPQSHIWLVRGPPEAIDLATILGEFFALLLFHQGPRVDDVHLQCPCAVIASARRIAPQRHDEPANQTGLSASGIKCVHAVHKR
jgi:hypothetical protein